MPNDQKVTRKLTAIMSADVKGYSLLMSEDEIHTIQTLKTHRQIMSEYIQQHTGRVVDSPGDNLLAEFGSAVDAVRCAVEIQKRLKKENDRFVKDKRLEFRIGVNVGDVVLSIEGKPGHRRCSTTRSCAVSPCDVHELPRTRS